MNVTRAFVVFHLLLFVVSLLLFACAKDDNPAASPECGSGRVFWDEKTGCRDAATNAKLPDSCCGR
jgi:hypothetical protein